MLRLYDTAIGSVRELALREPGKVSMYVCGPTVYDVPHVGHGRFTLVWDIMRRYLEWSGYEVKYVSNITDIEDKIIRRAAADGVSTDEIVKTYEKAWWDAMHELGVLPPDSEPHATGYVQQMVDYIAALVDGGVAYETGDGVYFSVSSVPDYGLLARQTLESLRSGARVEVNEDKRNPLDFALWKKAKPGEPTWDSPWGPGRPGWHIECTVMALDLLGDGFDLHGGGIDLAFPHHENERAQALGRGRAFARHWVHNGMVEVGGEKMSKSLGNYTSLTDLLSQGYGRAYRLLVLRAHYRSPITVDAATLADAREGMERLDAFARSFNDGAAVADAAALDQFRTFMDDDFNTPRATALLFDLVRAANKGDAAAGAAAMEICDAVGLELRSGLTEDMDAETLALMAARDAARAEREWARADELRARLQAAGWIVEDGPEGTTVRRP